MRAAYNARLVFQADARGSNCLPAGGCFPQLEKGDPPGLGQEFKLRPLITWRAAEIHIRGDRYLPWPGNRRVLQQANEYIALLVEPAIEGHAAAGGAHLANAAYRQGRRMRWDFATNKVTAS